MKKLKRILRKLLFPGAAIVIFSALIGAGLLAYTFLAAGEDTPIAYVSYAVSSYALAIVCANLVAIFQKGRRQVCKNPYIRRYMEDISFKLRFSLHCSLAVNLLYAGVNAFSGIWYRSPWFGSLAAYYIFLSVMRVSLVRYAHKHGFGENMQAEWRRYQLCGIVLALMNIALAGVVILVIHQDKGFEYAGSLIYAMAAYTFYIAISAVVNVVRYRKYHSPVMSAAKVVNLVAALVSMLSLETAMLTRFGGEDPSDFRQIMTGITGGCICGIVVGMGIYMIVHAAGQLKNSRSET